MASLNRRQFLVMSGLTAASSILPNTAFASKSVAPSPRILTLSSIHTGETARTEYFDGQHYLGEGLAQLNHICRDFRQDEATMMDRRLYDKLNAIRLKLNVGDAPIKIIGGYRSPATNNMLRKKSSKVAKKSFHMTGQAIDFYIEGVPMSQVHKAALSLRSGGVGRYSRFIHIDTGPTRSWG
ncbi:YcbK family protein [Motilimonas eburnea]|uniref:YcbK family protein n=1 Tax=Motilimonas eburnea TaxID=1737488 RepID=UPI001E461167|nr:YcbK family protein [Motilimonas eburnea]MCE2570498.1 YcbK family protein [Motilimonas eburnea]